MHVSGNAITVDMSALHRPAAHGTILDNSDISVTFPDDKTYTAKLQAPNAIHWSNNTTWTRVAVAVGPVLATGAKAGAAVLTGKA